MSRASERGAVAVEFALLAPVLIMILLGIMEFGRAYNTQLTLTEVAREGVRVMVIDNSRSAARTAAKAAATSLNPALKDSDIQFLATDGTENCSATKQMTVTIKYTLSTMTGIAGPFAMTGKGTMLCGG
jgi:Flp pilus assembly protein TadG